MIIRFAPGRAGMRWLRRHAFRLAQLGVLAWIALELHGLNVQAGASAVDPADVAEIADRLDDLVDAMQPPERGAAAEQVARRHGADARPRHSLGGV